MTDRRLLFAVAGFVGALSACSATGPAPTPMQGALDSGSFAGSCTQNSECDATREFCRKNTCNPAASGTCDVRPGPRATFYCSFEDGGGLVCGCDGQVYDYACVANAQGINVASSGACPLPDGRGDCTAEADCVAAGLYCKKAQCGAAAGSCQPRPAFLTCVADASVVCVDSGPNVSTCTVTTAVACGCEHLTYDNDCAAASYGINLDFEGPCPPPPSGPCMSQADCGDPSYANLVFCKPTPCGGAAGQCTARPRACPRLFNPVCGCDGKSYSNSCFSDRAGAGVAHIGTCP